MPFLVAAQLTAIATVVLALFAILTAAVAIAAFLKQREELHTLRQQVKGQQVLTDQQAAMNQAQSRQLDVEREQLETQRKLTTPN